MNRAERRKEQKKYMKAGMNKRDAKDYVTEHYKLPRLQEGQKVKLNYEYMRRQSDWIFQSEEFKNWVYEHRNDILTIEYDKERKEKNSDELMTFLSLKEDPGETKWIFRSDAFVPVACAHIKLDTGENIDVPLEGVTDPNDSKVQESITAALEKIE